MMNRQMLRNAIVALGVISATVAASLGATGCGGESSRDASAATMLSSVPAVAVPEKLPRPLGPGEQKLSPGVHVLDLVSREQGRTGYAHLPRIVITLPSGWFNFNGWALNDGGTLSVAFWDVAKVYPTPCRWQGKPMIDPGRTVEGLARALAARPLRHASRPTDVALAGFRGKYLSWSVPRRIDFSRCGQGYFESWTGRGWASDRWQQGPGQVDRLWILDLNGQRLVVDAGHMPWATRGQRAELDRVVRSIRFLRARTRRKALASVLTGAAHGLGRRVARNGRWIAYSTAPAVNYSGSGSDVFIISAGGPPELVAGRDSGAVWNICPAFSPNGKLLAFGRGTAAPRDGSAIVVVGVTREGTIGAPRAILQVTGRRARCPRWSADSSRLAYLDRNGKLVVRGLGGSRLHRSAGDPTIRDFDRSESEILSPAGSLIARLSDSTIVISRPDGSHRRVIKDEPNYAIAGWSPDGQKLLVMRDVGGGFTMRAVSVDAPFASETVADYVRVNGARSWPRYGDVSWQPIR